MDFIIGKVGNNVVNLTQSCSLHLLTKVLRDTTLATFVISQSIYSSLAIKEIIKKKKCEHTHELINMNYTMSTVYE